MFGSFKGDLFRIREHQHYSYSSSYARASHTSHTLMRLYLDSLKWRRKD